MQLGRVWAMMVLVAACSDDPPSERQVASVQSALNDAFATPDDSVDVIVSFREPAARDMGHAARAAYYRELQNGLMQRHGAGFAETRRFAHVPGIAGRITRAALASLREDPTVDFIQLDGTGSGQLKEAVPAIGGDRVKALYNLTGKGVRVAVLDTGVASMHPDLHDAVVAQHCFTQRDCPPALSREGTSAEDDHGHGSNVSGIIVSNGVVASVGFAPDAELVAVKINDQNDSGRVSDWVAGLDWVYQNLATLNVKVVNLSICTNALYADAAECDRSEPALARAVKNLTDAGVTVFAASGNLGLTDKLSAPACNTGAIAVAATYDSNLGPQPAGGGTYASQFGASIADCAESSTALDQITCFSNTPARLDLVAPGAPMTSAGLNGQTTTFRGTSQASPVAAGVAALMLQCNPALTPAQIKSALTGSGVSRLDAKSGRSFPSLRALAAVRAACPWLDGAAVDAGVAANSGATGDRTLPAPSAGTSGASNTLPFALPNGPGLGGGPFAPSPGNATGMLQQGLDVAGSPANGAGIAGGSSLAAAATDASVTSGGCSLAGTTRRDARGLGFGALVLGLWSSRRSRRRPRV